MTTTQQMSLSKFLIDTTPDYSKLHPGTIWMIIGFEKSGKTTAASTFSPKGEDGVLILDLERGVRTSSKISVIVNSLNPPFNKDGGLIPFDQRGEYDIDGKPLPALSMSEAMDLIEQTWHDSGKTTLVLDTVDALYHWCLDAAHAEIVYEERLKPANNQNKAIIESKSAGDLPYGSGHIRAREKAIAIIFSLLDMIKDNGILVLNLHLKQTHTIEGKNMILRKGPMLPEGFTRILGANAEAICQFEIDQQGTRWADFAGYEEVVMGSRIKTLDKKKFFFRETGDTFYKQVLKHMQEEPV